MQPTGRRAGRRAKLLNAVEEKRMRYGVLVLAGLALAQPLPGQISADSAAIVALELEMSRLLAAGHVDEYATHLASDYARTTQQGKLEGREVALATWRARGAGVVMRPTELWVRVYGDAAVLTGVVGGAEPNGPRIRITKTFVRQQGHWRLAALHSSSTSAR
jgi:hypothetical protein